MLFFIMIFLLLLNTDIAAMNVKQAPESTVEVKKPALSAMTKKPTIANIRFPKTSSAIDLFFDPEAFAASFKLMCNQDLVFCTLKEDLVDGHKVQQCLVDLDKLEEFLRECWHLLGDLNENAWTKFIVNPDEKTAEAFFATLSDSKLILANSCCAASFLSNVFGQILELCKDADQIVVIRSKETVKDVMENFKDVMENAFDGYLITICVSLGIFQKMVREDKRYAVWSEIIEILLQKEQYLYDGFRMIFKEIEEDMSTLASDPCYADFIDDVLDSGSSQPSKPVQERWGKAFEVLSAILAKINGN